VHVTLRVAKHVYNLRSRRSFSVIGRAIGNAAERFGVRIVEFSVQGNHMHLVVEAGAHEALSRAMQGFSIRVAKGLNAMMNRRGRVLADRYHARVLETPLEARRAVLYVRNNHRKHMAQVGKPLPRSFVDPFASNGADIELAAPRTWLLRGAVGPAG
jgi:REP element-mobilizing transposase RayT